MEMVGPPKSRISKFQFYSLFLVKTFREATQAENSRVGTETYSERVLMGSWMSNGRESTINRVLDGSIYPG